MRRERFVTIKQKNRYEPPKHINIPEKNIALSIMAKPGRVFDNYLLYETMDKLGFNLADNNVFEYLLPNSKDIAFSIINMRPPNTFNKEPESLPKTNGIIAVMQLPIGDGDNQIQYFNLLISILDELKATLNGELCDLNRNLLKNKTLYKVQKEIEAFEQSYTAIIQNDYQRSNI
ncbi:MAG: hypothetical protein KGV50_01705 [Gammaproteobacteria bacterium]|nr:hypothetical protein [Gammaproteobacteria bacterium]